MKIVFGDPKIVENDPVEPVIGSFSLTSPLTWYKCREQFAKFFDESIEGFFFSHEKGRSENIAAFISKTEDILEVSHPSITRSEFSQTNRWYAMWIKPSNFWKECGLRRSLFTILLRSGFEYNPGDDNYEAALISCPYARDTQLAVRRFLFGHTSFNMNGENWSPGWRDFFIGKDIEEVRKRLTLSKNTTVEKTMVCLGTIWN